VDVAAQIPALPHVHARARQTARVNLAQHVAVRPQFKGNVHYLNATVNPEGSATPANSNTESTSYLTKFPPQRIAVGLRLPIWP